MKSILMRLLMIPLILVYQMDCWSQQLPNASFEDWDGPTTPLEWTTPNGILPGVIPAFRSDQARSGSFAITLRTAAGGFADVPGLAGLVDLDIITRRIAPGVAFSARPDSVTGYYTYISGGCRDFGDVNVCPDACRVTLLLTKWVNGQRITIGEANYTDPDTVLSYKRFSAPVNYVSDEMPDSLLFLLSSSSEVSDTSFFAVRGSQATFDDLFLVYNSSRSEELPLRSPSRWITYPNPANHTLHIEGLTTNDLPVFILDQYGQRMATLNSTGHENISCDTWRPGLYFIQARNTSKVVSIVR